MEQQLIQLYRDSVNVETWSFVKTKTEREIKKILDKIINKKQATQQLKEIIKNIPTCFNADPLEDDECETNLSTEYLDEVRWEYENTEGFFIPILIESLLDKGAEINKKDIDTLFESIVTTYYDFDGWLYYIKDYMINFSVIGIIKLLLIKNIEAEYVMKKIINIKIEYKDKKFPLYVDKGRRGGHQFHSYSEIGKYIPEILQDIVDYINASLIEKRLENEGKIPSGIQSLRKWFS